MIRSWDRLRNFDLQVDFLPFDRYTLVLAMYTYMAFDTHMFTDERLPFRRNNNRYTTKDSEMCNGKPGTLTLQGQLIRFEGTDLERCFGVMLVDDAEGADVGPGSADLGRHIDHQFVFVDQSMVTAAPGNQIQTRDLCIGGSGQWDEESGGQ